MDRLVVKEGRIVNENGQPLALRGTCVGGWMNMENFINGYPGDERGTRLVMAQVLGAEKAEFFFDRLLDYFMGEDDIRFMKECGATVVRLPLNYRHFERDDAPFEYLEKGFARLDEALGWCAKYGLYAILDLHAVQGYQNTDWHSDNSSRQTLFWDHKHFQDRFVALWEEFARRYKDNTALAGYNVMNEPVSNARFGRFSNKYETDWEKINSIYRRVVEAIRAIDPTTIIYLEGDYFSNRFDNFEPPFAENLVYSSHNYTPAGFGPGPYPGTFNGVQWDRAKQKELFRNHQGPTFARKYNVPLWVGEFGSVYNGPANEMEDRLQALDDQLSVFEEHDAHWTTWTYKDVGVMGWVTLNPESEYMRVIKPALEAKYDLYSDFWMRWLPPTKSVHAVGALADVIEQTVNDPDLDRPALCSYLTQAALSCFVGNFLQPYYARCFEGMSETDLDRVLSSFALNKCVKNEGLISVVKKHMTK